MKTRPWDYEEDKIVCAFYLNNFDTYRKCIQIVMNQLAIKGYSDRKKSAVLMRIANYQSLHINQGLCNVSKQSQAVYKDLIRNYKTNEV